MPDTGGAVPGLSARRAPHIADPRASGAVSSAHEREGG